MTDLKTDFEAIVLRELSRAWINQTYAFKWSQYKLISPHFILTDAKVSHIGQWDPTTRQMSFSRSLVSERPWNEVLEVLKHEMAHQFVSEVLHIDNEDPHGDTFKGVCKKYGIDAAPRGLPGASKITTTNHIVEKIQHLLKLANDGGAMEEEAKTAAETAHRLMLKYNIDVQLKNEERGYTVRFLGGITGRIQAYMNRLANILSRHYFVEIIWATGSDPRTGKKGHELEISGTKDNVEVAEYVYEFLSRAAIEAWERKFADPVFKMKLSNEFADQFGYGEFTSPRGYTISARSNFLDGFICGFGSQLNEAAAKEVEAGLVLAKDTGLEEFYKVRNPRVCSLASSGGKYNAGVRSEGFGQGKALKIPNAAKSGKKFVPLLGK